MVIDKNTVTGAARAAALNLTDAEAECAVDFLKGFFDYAKVLDELDLSGYSAEDEAVGIDALRSDTAVSFVSKQALLSCAHTSEEDGIIVPGVVE